MKKAGHISRDNLLSFGTCFGKFTKTGKFRLHVTALDFLAPYAKVINNLIKKKKVSYLLVVALGVKQLKNFDDENFN